VTRARRAWDRVCVALEPTLTLAGVAVLIALSTCRHARDQWADYRRSL
jgi:hypothetical protein